MFRKEMFDTQCMWFDKAEKEGNVRIFKGSRSLR